MGTAQAVNWRCKYARQATRHSPIGLGWGWEHPFAARLLLPTQPGGETARVSVVGPDGNHYRFHSLGNGLLSPFPGVPSSMRIDSNGNYVQTWVNQSIYTYRGSDGVLIGIQDEQGRSLGLTYDSSTPPRVVHIVDSSNSARFLHMTYTNGQIATVSDGIRTVRYTYTAAGDLDTVSDVMGRVTTYTYQNHLLTGIQNAANQWMEQTVYDQYTWEGKAVEQTLLNGQHFVFDYQSNHTLVTIIVQGQLQETREYRYDTRTTLLVG